MRGANISSSWASDGTSPRPSRSHAPCPPPHRSPAGVPAAGTIGLDENHIPRADLQRPLILARIREAGGAVLIIDGWHRLARAQRDGVADVPAVLLDGIWEQAADELRHEALDTLGVVGVPLRRSHSTRPVSLYGQWTVDLVFSGSDHQAVRAAFDAEVPQAAADWAAHPERFPRVEMPKNGRVAGMSKNTPEAVRRAAQALPRHPPSLQNPVRRCLAGGAMLKTCGSVSGGHAEGVPSRLIL
jgi:nitrogen fixation protein